MESYEILNKTSIINKYTNNTNLVTNKSCITKTKGELNNAYLELIKICNNILETSDKKEILLKEIEDFFDTHLSSAIQQRENYYVKTMSEIFKDEIKKEINSHNNKIKDIEKTYETQKSILKSQLQRRNEESEKQRKIHYKEIIFLRELVTKQKTDPKTLKALDDALYGVFATYDTKAIEDIDMKEGTNKNVTNILQNPIQKRNSLHIYSCNATENGENISDRLTTLRAEVDKYKALYDTARNERDKWEQTAKEAKDQLNDLKKEYHKQSEEYDTLSDYRWYEHGYEGGKKEKKAIISAFKSGNLSHESLTDSIISLLAIDELWEEIEKRLKGNSNEHIKEQLQHYNENEPVGNLLSSVIDEEDICIYPKGLYMLQSCIKKENPENNYDLDRLEPAKNASSELVQCTMCYSTGYIKSADAIKLANNDAHLKKALSRVLELKNELSDSQEKINALESKLQDSILSSNKIKEQIDNIHKGHLLMKEKACQTEESYFGLRERRFKRQYDNAVPMEHTFKENTENATIISEDMSVADIENDQISENFIIKQDDARQSLENNVEGSISASHLANNVMYNKPYTKENGLTQKDSHEVDIQHFNKLLHLSEEKERVLRRELEEVKCHLRVSLDSREKEAEQRDKELRTKILAPLTSTDYINQLTNIADMFDVNPSTIRKSDPINMTSLGKDASDTIDGTNRLEKIVNDLNMLLQRTENEYVTNKSIPHVSLLDSVSQPNQIENDPPHLVAKVSALENIIKKYEKEIKILKDEHGEKVLNLTRCLAHETELHLSSEKRYFTELGIWQEKYSLLEREKRYVEQEYHIYKTHYDISMLSVDGMPEKQYMDSIEKESSFSNNVSDLDNLETCTNDIQSRSGLASRQVNLEEEKHFDLLDNIPSNKEQKEFLGETQIYAYDIQPSSGVETKQLEIKEEKTMALMNTMPSNKEQENFSKEAKKVVEFDEVHTLIIKNIKKNPSEIDISDVDEIKTYTGGIKEDVQSQNLSEISREERPTTTLTSFKEESKAFTLVTPLNFQSSTMNLPVSENNKSLAGISVAHELKSFIQPSFPKSIEEALNQMLTALEFRINENTPLNDLLFQVNFCQTLIRYMYYRYIDPKVNVTDSAVHEGKFQLDHDPILRDRLSNKYTNGRDLDVIGNAVIESAAQDLKNFPIAITGPQDVVGQIHQEFESRSNLEQRKLSEPEVIDTSYQKILSLRNMEKICIKQDAVILEKPSREDITHLLNDSGLHGTIYSNSNINSEQTFCINTNTMPKDRFSDLHKPSHTNDMYYKNEMIKEDKKNDSHNENVQLRRSNSDTYNVPLTKHNDNEGNMKLGYDVPANNNILLFTDIINNEFNNQEADQFKNSDVLLHEVIVDGYKRLVNTTKRFNDNRASNSIQVVDNACSSLTNMIGSDGQSIIASAEKSFDSVAPKRKQENRNRLNINRPTNNVMETVIMGKPGLASRPAYKDYDNIKTGGYQTSGNRHSISEGCRHPSEIFMEKESFTEYSEPYNEREAWNNNTNAHITTEYETTATQTTLKDSNDIITKHETLQIHDMISNRYHRSRYLVKGKKKTIDEADPEMSVVHEERVLPGDTKINRVYNINIQGKNLQPSIIENNLEDKGPIAYTESDQKTYRTYELDYLRKSISVMIDKQQMLVGLRWKILIDKLEYTLANLRYSQMIDQCSKRYNHDRRRPLCIDALCVQMHNIIQKRNYIVKETSNNKNNVERFYKRIQNNVLKELAHILLGKKLSKSNNTFIPETTIKNDTVYNYNNNTFIDGTRTSKNHRINISINGFPQRNLRFAIDPETGTSSFIHAMTSQICSSSFFKNQSYNKEKVHRKKDSNMIHYDFLPIINNQN